MPDRFNMDYRDVTVLAADLEDGARYCPDASTRVVAKGALNIKRGARERVAGLKHAPAYPRSIGYNKLTLPSGPAAEIGPDKERTQGALGNILEYGTENNAPIPHMIPAAEDELPRFTRAMEGIAVRPVTG